MGLGAGSLLIWVLL